MKIPLRMAALTFGVTMALYGDIIYLGPVADAGGGFGSVANLLTISANNPTASGCSGIGSNGDEAIGSGVCPGGFTGGDESPPAGSPKNETFLLSAVGPAIDVGIVYNASQPGGGPVTLDDLALSVFDANGNILGTVGGNIICAPGVTAGTCANGSVTLDFTQPGVGNAGFLFGLTDTQAAQLAVLAGGGDFRIGFAANITGEAGGLETFSLVDLNIQQEPVVPEPGTYALMTSGLLGLVFWNRRRKA